MFKLSEVSNWSFSRKIAFQKCIVMESASNHHEYIEGMKAIFSKYQQGVADQNNFMWNTVAEFSQLKSRPHRKPDFVSRDKFGQISSEYWFTKNGVIRGSNHWGPNISTCDWALDSVSGCRAASEITRTFKLYGKAKWSDFVQKTEPLYDSSRKVFGFTSFSNTKGKDCVEFNGSIYHFFENFWSVV